MQMVLVQIQKELRVLYNFQHPKELKDVRSFLGLTGYYRRYTHHYAKIITTLLELLTKAKKWK